MKFQSFEEILIMIRKAFKHTFYGDANSVKNQCIEAATRIYIEQMRIKAYGPTGYSEQYEAQEDLDNEDN